MNEKIKQLAEQAYLYQEDDNFLTAALENFAELIVKECAGIVEDYGLLLISSDENYLGETLNLSIRVQEAGNKIKQHFGVEE